MEIPGELRPNRPIKMARRSVYLLIVPVLILLVIGIVMLSSTAAFVSDGRDDIYMDVKRQLWWILLGVVAAAAAALVDYRVWKTWAWFGYWVGVVLLALCFVPGVGQEINGARRWVGAEFLGFAGLRFQASEVAKITAIVGLAAWFSRYRSGVGTFFDGYAKPMVMVGVVVALIAAEVDLGTAALLGSVSGLVMFVAGTRIWYLGATAFAGIAALALAVKMMPNRLERWMAFLDPEAHRFGLGLQQWRAMLGFGSGGVYGVGVGEGRQKMLDLPFAHTDFIFPMVGEEMGLLATLPVVLCFVCIAVAGTCIATHAKDRFGRLLGIGLVGLISAQALINIGVTTACLPNKGIPLPFLSYGGSNLVCCMLGIGILINIYRQGDYEAAATGGLRVGKRKMTPRL